MSPTRTLPVQMSVQQEPYPPSHEAVGESGLATVGQTDDGYTQDSGVLWLVWFQQQFEILLSCLWKWDPCKTMNKTTTMNCLRNCAYKVSFSKQMCSFPETTNIYSYSQCTCELHKMVAYICYNIKNKSKKVQKIWMKMKIYVVHNGLYLLQYEKQN